MAPSGKLLATTPPRHVGPAHIDRTFPSSPPAMYPVSDPVFVTQDGHDEPDDIRDNRQSSHTLVETTGEGIVDIIHHTQIDYDGEEPVGTNGSPSLTPVVEYGIPDGGTDGIDNGTMTIGDTLYGDEPVSAKSCDNRGGSSDHVDDEYITDGGPPTHDDYTMVDEHGTDGPSTSHDDNHQVDMAPSDFSAVNRQIRREWFYRAVDRAANAKHLARQAILDALGDAGADIHTTSGSLRALSALRAAGITVTLKEHDTRIHTIDSKAVLAREATMDSLALVGVDIKTRIRALRAVRALRAAGLESKKRKAHTLDDTKSITSKEDEHDDTVRSLGFEGEIVRSNSGPVHSRPTCRTSSCECVGRGTLSSPLTEHGRANCWASMSTLDVTFGTVPEADRWLVRSGGRALGFAKLVKGRNGVNSVLIVGAYGRSWDSITIDGIYPITWVLLGRPIEDWLENGSEVKVVVRLNKDPDFVQDLWGNISKGWRSEVCWMVCENYDPLYDVALAVRNMAVKDGRV